MPKIRDGVAVMLIRITIRTFILYVSHRVYHAISLSSDFVTLFAHALHSLSLRDPARRVVVLAAIWGPFLGKFLA